MLVSVFVLSSRDILLFAQRWKGIRPRNRYLFLTQPHFPFFFLLKWNFVNLIVFRFSRTHRKAGTGDKYRTVQSMVAHEVKENLINHKARDSTTGTRNLLRLHRALEYINAFLQVLPDLENSEKCCPPSQVRNMFSLWERFWGQPPRPNFPRPWATMLALRIDCSAAALGTLQRVYPTENWLSSRCLPSQMVRELVFPSWPQPLTIGSTLLTPAKWDIIIRPNCFVARLELAEKGFRLSFFDLNC